MDETQARRPAIQDPKCPSCHRRTGFNLQKVDPQSNPYAIVHVPALLWRIIRINPWQTGGSVALLFFGFYAAIGGLAGLVSNEPLSETAPASVRFGNAVVRQGIKPVALTVISTVGSAESATTGTTSLTSEDVEALGINPEVTQVDWRQP